MKLLLKVGPLEGHELEEAGTLSDLALIRGLPGYEDTYSLVAGVERYMRAAISGMTTDDVRNLRDLLDMMLKREEAGNE